MHWLEALLLGIIQGLTEFLPVSSSGHLELGNAILGTAPENNLTFAIVVHGATVLSTIVVFWKDLVILFNDFFKFKWNNSTRYIFKILVSMIPVAIIGLFFEESIASLFNGNILLVGPMLIITAILLTLTYFSKEKQKEISFFNAFIIGISQAIAVIPGISRSGATISTGLMMGNKKESIAKFSFLMVIIPIIGANVKDIVSSSFAENNIDWLSLLIGFCSAFICGLLACKLMINIVKRSKLVYFGVYCFIIGLTAILLS